MQKVIRFFVVWRILLFIPVFLAGYFVTLRNGYLFSNPWANFDGVHYLSIAQGGYINQSAFFPLYPFLISVLTFGNQVFFSGFFVSNTAFLISLYFFYKLLSLDYKENRRWEILLIMLLFPTSFFFGAVYSEALFLLFLVSSFYFARKGKWVWASILGMLLTGTRLIGIFILPALLYEYFIQRKTFKGVFPLTLIPLGIISYSIFNFKMWGDWLYFVHTHSQLSNGRVTNGIIFPFQTVYRYIKIFLTLPINQYEWWIALLELVSFVGVSILLYFAWKKKVRVSYLIFSVLAFLLPVSSGTFSGLPRYVLVLFPIYIVLSYMSGKIRRIYLVISTIILVVLLMFFSRGYFVA
jgi:Gpi18-like mannosyltransferase